jgi:hypothetical protein
VWYLFDQRWEQWTNVVCIQRSKIASLLTIVFCVTLTNNKLQISPASLCFEVRTSTLVLVLCICNTGLPNSSPESKKQHGKLAARSHMFRAKRSRDLIRGLRNDVSMTAFMFTETKALIGGHQRVSFQPMCIKKV